MNPFRDAAKALPGHWYKGDYADGHGNYCAVGHVCKVMGATEAEFANQEAENVLTLHPTISSIMQNVTLEFTNGATQYIAELNDDEDTTEDDIVALLEKAAVRYDEIKDLTD